MAAKIKFLKAREILDSRGNPTLETTLILSDDVSATSAVPSGASTGKFEAVELRDKDKERFHGLGVLKAVNNVNSKIFPLIKSLQVDKQEVIDQLMIDLDGTENKRRLGANAILSVSQVLVKAAAVSCRLPLYHYFKKRFKLVKRLGLPRPTFNLINAGKHGSAPVEFQEFHLLPQSPKTFKRQLQMGQEVYHALGLWLEKLKIGKNVGDEGGYSPRLLSNLDGLELLRKAVKSAGYKLGTNVFLGLDVAATQFFSHGRYCLKDFSQPVSDEKLSRFYQEIVSRFHLRYLEDPFSEEEWGSWQRFKGKATNSSLLIVGDDLLCTNPKRIKMAIEKSACNAVLVKPNQIGTVTEALAAIKIAKAAGWQIIVSHRSGETNDDFIADFAVGVGADLVKFGAPARGERVAKYNRLLQIESEISQKA